MTSSNNGVTRSRVSVDGVELSYLASGDPDAPPLLLVHGTFWSRLWAPVMAALGHRFRCVAVDLPGFGRSDGELTPSRASVPAMAGTFSRIADALGFATFDLAGHDIGGGIAQHVAATTGRVMRLVLMNAVVLDSWPVPAVERFRDPAVRESTSVEQLLEARAAATRRAVARRLTDAEVEEYISPWRDPVRAQSWMAMAAAADARYTVDLVPALQRAAVPTRLVWGRDDEFQKIEFARRFLDTMPDCDLVEVPGKHIPTEDDPDAVSAAIEQHLTV